MDANYGSEDIASYALEAMSKDCADFIAGNTKDLDGMNPSQAGHDFWLTRNHHGAGFWDRGLGALGERLTVSANASGEVWLYIGDDGKVYQG
jgi:hypothetical protein